MIFPFLSLHILCFFNFTQLATIYLTYSKWPSFVWETPYSWTYCLASVNSENLPHQHLSWNEESKSKVIMWKTISLPIILSSLFSSICFRFIFSLTKQVCMGVCACIHVCVHACMLAAWKALCKMMEVKIFKEVRSHINL